MDPEGRLLNDTITGLSTDTTLHYVQNESFKLNLMEFFAVSNMSNPGILEWKRPLRYPLSEVQASRKQRITDHQSAMDAKIQNRNQESNSFDIKQHSKKMPCPTFSEGVKVGFNADSVIECFIPQLTVHLRNDAKRPRRQPCISLRRTDIHKTCSSIEFDSGVQVGADLWRQWYPYMEMDPEGRLLKDTITGLSTDTTLHYVQNESFKLNFMEFFAVSSELNPGILEWKRPLRNHRSEVQASRKQRITAYRSAIDEKIQNRNPDSNSALQALLIDQYDHNNVDFNNANYFPPEEGENTLVKVFKNKECYVEFFK
ncbi:unnamed protein product [Caenorhabditis brenneri]